MNILNRKRRIKKEVAGQHLNCYDDHTLGLLYRDALHNDVVPFWERHSIDNECGGYFSCLDRKGDVFDTDKFIWMQARQVWMFAMLFNRVRHEHRWLDIARHGAMFLRQHGRDADGYWYYALDRQGRPLMQPFTIFTDCFAAMAFSQYSLASGDAEARQIAMESYQHFLRRCEAPKGRFSKAVPGTRPLLPLASRMIHLNMLLEMEWQLDQAEVEQTAKACVNEIMTLFLDPVRGLLYENVAPDGSHPDCFEGRMINPGHGLEVLWMVMATARRWGMEDVIETAVDASIRTVAYGWDPEYGGIVYRRDIMEKPPLQMEWDRKLSWVHAETMVALSLGYALTGRRDCRDWLEKVHAYVWPKFVDPVHGEWFGYLDRRGEVLLDVKGNRWKTCYHVPRAMYLASEQLLSLKPDDSKK